MLASLSPAFLTPLPAGSTESGEAGLVFPPVASQEAFATLLNTFLGMLGPETASSAEPSREPELAVMLNPETSPGGEGIDQEESDPDQPEEETAVPAGLMALSLPLAVALPDPGPANPESSLGTADPRTGLTNSSIGPQPVEDQTPGGRRTVYETGSSVRATEGAPPSARANEAQASDLVEPRPCGPVTDRPPSQPAQPSFPASELAFAARLTDRGTAQARQELLASLSSAPPTYALASQRPAAPASLPAQPSFPASELASAARLTDRGTAQARQALLASLSSAPPTYALPSQDPAAPASLPESGQTPDKPGTSPVDPTEPAPPAAPAGSQPQASRAPFNQAPQTTSENLTPEAPPEPRSMAQKSAETPPLTPAEFVRARASSASGQRPPVEPPQDEGKVLRIAPPLDRSVLTDSGPAPATRSGPAHETSSRQSPPQSLPAAAEEPLSPQAHQAKPEPLRELSLVVPGRQAEGRTQGSVEVRVLERAGEVRLSVRTPDTELANSLRQQLGDLVGRLEQTGYQAETWRPAEVSPVSARHHNSRDCGDSSSAGHGRHPDAGGQPGHQHGRQRQDQPEWAQALAGAEFQPLLAPWNSTRSVAHGFAN